MRTLSNIVIPAGGVRTVGRLAIQAVERRGMNEVYVRINWPPIRDDTIALIVPSDTAWDFTIKLGSVNKKTMRLHDTVYELTLVGITPPTDASAFERAAFLVEEEVKAK
jgi:hypothetical protein